MILEAPTGPLKVAFEHERFFDRGLTRFTTCRLYTSRGPNLWDLAATGYAQCHPNDNYRKRKGRKTSFGRALRKMEPNHSVRADLWSQYFEKLPGDRR